MVKTYEITKSDDPGKQLALLRVNEPDDVRAVFVRDPQVRKILNAPTRRTVKTRLVSFQDGIGVSVGRAKVRPGHAGYFDALVAELAGAGFDLKPVVVLLAQKSMSKGITGRRRAAHKYIRVEPAPTGDRYVYEEPHKDAITIPGVPHFKFSVYRSGKEYVVTEDGTGMVVAKGESPEYAIQKAQHSIGKKSLAEFNNLMASHYAARGLPQSTFKPGDAVLSVRPGLFGMPYKLAGTVYNSQGMLRVKINPGQPVAGAKTMGIIGWWPVGADLSGPPINDVPEPKTQAELKVEKAQSDWEAAKRARLAVGTWGVLPSELTVGDILEAAWDGNRYVVSEMNQYGVAVKPESEYMVGPGGSGIGGENNEHIPEYRKVGHFDLAVAEQRMVDWMRANIEDAKAWVKNNPELNMQPLLDRALVAQENS